MKSAMSALESVVRLAWDTFRFSANDKAGLLQKVKEIQGRAAALKIEDVGITEWQVKKLGPEREQGCAEIRAPVGYVEVFEDDLLAVGAFMLKSNVAMPLHNHPTMHGVLKVLHGSVKIKSFDILEKGSDEKLPFFRNSDFQPSLEDLEKLRFSSESEYTVDSEPCLVTPVEGNIHCLESVGGPAIFLDFISPPYNPSLGRDCYYYKELTVDEDDPNFDKNVVWAKQIECPRTYYCVKLDYLGPEIDMDK